MEQSWLINLSEYLNFAESQPVIIFIKLHIDFESVGWRLYEHVKA